MYNSNFKYFISTQMNRWRDTSQNINLNLWQKSEELIFKKDYVPDTTTKLTGQPHTTKTVLSNYDSYGLTNPLLVATTMAHMPFHYSNEKNPPVFPFHKRNEEKPNSKFKSWFHHKP